MIIDWILKNCNQFLNKPIEFMWKFEFLFEKKILHLSYVHKVNNATRFKSSKDYEYYKKRKINLIDERIYIERYICSSYQIFIFILFKKNITYKHYIHYIHYIYIISF